MRNLSCISSEDPDKMVTYQRKGYKKMEETCEKFFAWINKKEQIVTFRETEGFEMLTFQTRDARLSFVYHLCISGYRIL